MPRDPRARTRVRIAFLCLFVSIITVSVGAYGLINFDRLQESIAAREDQAVLRGVTDPAEIDEALRQHPSNKLLQLAAMATRAANETSAAIEKLSNEVEPPGVAKNANLGAASRSDLEAFRRDLKAAEANATTFLPRTTAVFKTERGNVEKYALSLRVDKDIVRRLLDSIDQRHAEITAFMSRLLSARAGYYRAYESYVAMLAAEFGNYKVVGGQFIFPFQRTVDRYNLAAQAMTVAAKQVAELEDERKGLEKSRQQRWQQFVTGQ
jgi:hypothetical protein